ncbi:MAG TPA: excinuclease ABC subunit UvrA [Desulfatirhabdiaceae bacterium]|nr:excinuclease ABC subunit UvrA [Desulfatirhabdiaceae bacterium]
MISKSIVIRGARQHNLKNIDLEIPKNRLVVITGLSGSGKSSLAFDTIYAEGQRRYVESLSTYARQFLERMEKPDVDSIEGLSPAIAIDQKSGGHNPRSTVGTITEIHDYLRLLFARAGSPFCHQCHLPIVSQTLDQMIDTVLHLEAGTRIMILSPVVEGQKGDHAGLMRRLKKQGFSRVVIDGDMINLETPHPLDKKKSHTIQVVVDRLIIKIGIQNRLADSMEMALSLSNGFANVDVMEKELISFSEKAVCLRCGISYPPFTPASFSFNSPSGACPSCSGLGSITGFDSHLLIPNPELSLREGAVVIWAKRHSVQFMDFLESLTQSYGSDIYTPYRDLSDEFRQVLLYGSGDKKIPIHIEKNKERITFLRTFEGIIPKLERQYRETESTASRDDLKRFMNFHPCPVCMGDRLNPAARSVHIGEKTISEINALSIAAARRFFNDLKLEGKQQIIAGRILKEIVERLSFLENVGLSYLTLDRSAITLSGGEGQRIRLATQIGSRLTGVLYVLDEPSIGLHQRDNRLLLNTLLTMRDMGNTVLVVEHDEETIRSADHVVDMGPGAGQNGGEIMFSGAPSMLAHASNSLTAQYMFGKKRIETPRARRPFGPATILVEGANGNNLKDISVEFPLGSFICVTGVSGSGKSTLVVDTLYSALMQRLYRSHIHAAPCRSIKGLEHIDKVVNIDQSPIGRTPRSNPATYTGVFNLIREVFSRTEDARMRGYKGSRFSFNVKGGRCEACGGDGIIKIEMHFLPDIYVPCDMCRGLRYNRETLEITYRGKHIADVLDMTVNQSLSFFDKIPAIHAKLHTLTEVGLGYIRLGQQAMTLSGGEAQRIKLAKELSRKDTGRTLYILDEPTTGLHMDDVNQLLKVLNRLIDSGNTVLVIEHHIEVIKIADYIIDLGPEGGDAGGFLVACGTPEAVSDVSRSYTGQYLKTVLNRDA